MFSRTFILFKVCLCVLTYIAYASQLKTVLLRKLSCLRQANVPSGVAFMNFSTRLHCAMGTVQKESGTALLVKTEKNGVVSCGLSEKISLLTPCNETSSNVTVFYSEDNLQVCPGPCVLHYQFLGVTYCILSPSTMSYSDCSSYCNSVNGEMLEARTQEDMKSFTDMVANGVKLWFGGNDLAVTGEYRWNRGDLVNKDLFLPGQPNWKDHHCLVLLKPSSLLGLNDLDCTLNYYCSCAIICKE